jgi:hypothetical protein
MTGVVLLGSGLFLLAWGCWRGYLAARSALLPLVREGDSTRSLVDATRPIHARTRVRLAVRNVGLSLLWLGLAMYGMYLATVGAGTLP